MRIEDSAPVIAVPLPGGLGNELYHLPAVEKRWSGRGGVSRGMRLAEYSVGGPESWPTVCGLDGLVYAYGGPIRKRRLCSVCRDGAPGALLVGDGSYRAAVA